MLNGIEIYVCLVVVLLAIFSGFVPKISTSLRECRKKSAIKQSKKNVRSINDYDDFDEDLYVLELEKEEAANAMLSKNPDAYDENGKPKANFFINAISLVIGFQSTISLIGIPVEFYYHGFKSLQITLSFVAAPVIIAVFFVPFIYRIKGHSVYEYLDDKFNDSKSVKYFTVLLMILFQLILSSLVLFSTCNTIMQILSLNHQVDLWPIVLVLGTTSFSLALLGLQSVIWANFFQFFIMVSCNILVILLGIKFYDGNQSESILEGINLMWNVTVSTGHNQFFSFAERNQDRYTFFNSLIGMTFNTIPTYCLTQQSFMRIKQAKSLRSARWLVLSIIPFGFINIALIVCVGAVILAFYAKCGDPMSTGSMKNQNQLLSMFLTQFYTKYTGLLGFYIALLISSAINTIASSLKGLSVTLSEDIFASFSNVRENNRKMSNSFNRTSYKMHKLSEKYGFSYDEEILNLQIRFNTSRNRRKIIKEYVKNCKHPNRHCVQMCVVLTGLVVIALAIALEKSTESLTSTALSILNSIHGPLLFVYLCAMFNDYSHKRNSYAHNRSTISKLNNLYIHYADVIISSVCAMGVVLFFYFGKMITFSEHKSFYTADHLHVIQPNLTVGSSNRFCQRNNTSLPLVDTSTNSSMGSEDIPFSSSGLEYYHYFFRISFAWYPFLGIVVCFLSLFVLSSIRFLVNKIAFQCLRRCYR